ncbi:MAG: cobyrinate a,c-diamide synthase [Nitratireductor sp.]
MIAAPSSGSGKTVITLALLRAFKNAGINVQSAKAGPDYIDPQFHAIASKSSSINLEPWGMSEDKLKYFANAQNGELLICEAMMGLFDGGADGKGSAADLAKTLGMPVVLVIDCAKQSHSVAALVGGFVKYDEAVQVAGVILNKVGSQRHESILRDALGKINMSVFGVVYRDEKLKLPSRHLGLVQAGEQDNIEDFIEGAAQTIAQNCDMALLQQCAAPLFNSVDTPAELFTAPLGKHIAIAKDEAFSFIYPHLILEWEKQGAHISYFSPLADEAPNENADAIYLPGGYPELHAQKLQDATQFHSAMHTAKARGVLIYGECGGYMVLGESIIDATGKAHKMLGLLNLQTSFEKRKLHLGYRRLEALDSFVMGQKLAAHEFHYTVAIKEEGTPLFNAKDALGIDVGNVGLRADNVMGSYMHIISRDV